jgi:hypothetical protein
MKELALRLGYDRDIIVPAKNTINFTKKAFFHIGQILRS